MASGDQNFPSFADIDPLFLIPPGCGLDLPEYCRDRRMVEWHAHQVRRSPADLLAHVRRIGLLRDLGNGDELADAMVDLFIALGDGGTPLKKGLLSVLAPLLPNSAATYLEARVHTRVEATECFPWNARPVLGRGYAASAVLTSPTRVAA